MVKVAHIGDFYIYKFDCNEVVVKGFWYGIVNIFSADKNDCLFPCDMDFFAKSKNDSISIALSWSWRGDKK